MIRQCYALSGRTFESSSVLPSLLPHIPGAVSLPSAVIWNDDGTFKHTYELAVLASSAVGDCTGKEIIVYCAVGGLASGWWFVQTELLGYRNVEFHEGSAQEWVMDPSGPMVTQ